MSKVETIELRPGYNISRVIRGGWQLSGGHGSVDRKAAVSDMKTFLDSGITTIDCADIYTGVEEIIGSFIENLRNECGHSIANSVKVHTKLVPDLARLPDIKPAEVENIVDRSLMRLKVQQLDLVQFFWWDISIGKATEMLGILKECQSKGKIANLGVTNWDSEQISLFLESGFDLISAQVQFSILDRRPLNGLTDWSRVKSMHLLCYGTLAGGFLEEKWLGKSDPGYSFSNRSLIKYRLIIDEFGSWELFQELLGVLKRIGDIHRVSLSSVAIRWVMEQPRVAATIVGARYACQLSKTLEVFKFKLTSQDKAAIAMLLDKASGPLGPVYGLESDRSSRHGRIMKYNLNNLPEGEIPESSSSE
ncbi:MAG: aldo/keto reductase [Paracoccaceae bacterium]|nr:aldo/keto reductase [Paracoccaceae bacterium]